MTSLGTCAAALRQWTTRRWVVAVLVAVAFALMVAIPTDLIDTSLFGREIPPTWWAWPSLVVSSALAGLLTATYVAEPGMAATQGTTREVGSGWIGGALTYFAVGCPVCNKLVILALGSAGALSWFEPIQPVLQLLAVGLLVWALRRRLLGDASCAVPSESPSQVQS